MYKKIKITEKASNGGDGILNRKKESNKSIP